MSFNMNMVAHLRAMRTSLAEIGGRAELDLKQMQLTVYGAGRYATLQPQYGLLKDGKIIYTRVLDDETTHFIGWRPHLERRWELSNSKDQFKRYCAVHNLRTPAQFTDARRIDTDVIIKRSVSSFGNGITGPFRHGRQEPRPLAAGEYYEAFVRGTIAKAWYWEDQLMALELKPMVELVGDGRSSVRELVDRIKSSFVSVDWASVADVARYDGVESLDEPVPEGRRVLCDFRYLSSLHSSRLTNLNVLPGYAQADVLHQLRSGGTVCWHGIPAPLRSEVVFTLDAIIDPTQTVWFLEMNSNPIVHPDVYPAMLRTVLGIQPSQPSLSAQPAQPAQPALSALSALSARAATPAADVARISWSAPLPRP